MPVPWLWNGAIAASHSTRYRVARLRPIGLDDLVDILHWSQWKERVLPFGPSDAPVKQALRIFLEASIFWTGV
jgi:hypothetical protein